MEFYCHGFWAGTSGSPWIIGYNAKTGTGTVFGVIGGYQEGGDYEWASYSAYFGSALRSLFTQAERQPSPPPRRPRRRARLPRHRDGQLELLSFWMLQGSRTARSRQKERSS